MVAECDDLKLMWQKQLIDGKDKMILHPDRAIIFASDFHDF